MSITEFMPESFQFYHLGEVTASNHAVAEDMLDPMETVGVAFTLQGDVRGTVVIAFDMGLDTSTYTEMGNIIVSRMATELQNCNGQDVSISPPKFLEGEPLQTWIRQTQPKPARTYLHVHQGKAVLVKSLISLSEENGHA